VTPEQNSLLEKAEESLQAAALLAGEGFHAFAVSRAYYAMFYCAEALVLELGLAFSKHSGVIAAFGERFVKTGKVDSEFHRFLIEAQESRNAGDYDVSAEFSKDDSAEQIERARRFITLTRNLLSQENPV
jgi:uncharacterized protein (UPF0332 family)